MSATRCVGICLKMFNILCAVLWVAMIVVGAIYISNNYIISIWMIVRGVLGLLEQPLSAISLWMECDGDSRPTGCTPCEVISSMLGLVTTISDIVGSVLIFPHYNASPDCSATTDNPLCQDSYQSVDLFAFALAIYGLISNALVFLYRIVLCIQ